MHNEAGSRWPSHEHIFLSSRRYVEQLERWRIGGVEKQERLRYANTQVSTMGLASGM